MKLLRLASLAVLLLIAALVVRSLRVTTDLSYFLPEGNATSQAESEILRALSQSELSRRIAIAVSGKDENQVLEATKALKIALGKLPLRLSSGPAEVQELAAELFSHRYQFISDQPEQELPVLLGRDGLRALIDRLKETLGSPAGSLVREVAVKDPLLLSSRMLERLSKLNATSLTSKEGVLVSEDGKAAVLFAVSREGAFEGPAQAQLWSQLDALFPRISAQYGNVTIEASALARHAVSAERSMRADMLRVSTISTVAVLMLLWIVFVRLRYLPLLLLPLGAGFLVGTGVCLLAFGTVHAMTFAFGSALIGVATDYPVHLVNHLVLERGDAAGSRRHSYIALVLGAFTTVLGLLCLVWGGLPGLREIAVFGASGVSTALVVSLLWVPVGIEPGDRVPPLRHLKIAEICGNAFNWLRSHRFAHWLVLLVACVVCALGLPQVKWQDDPRKLTTLDPTLALEDSRVQKLVAGEEGAELVVLTGLGSEQQLLKANDKLALVLERAVQDKILGGYSSLHHLIWSEELQARNLDWIRAELPEGAIKRALEQAEFASDAFAPFGENGSALRVSPLRLADLSRRSYQELITPWFLSLAPGKRGLLTRLRGVKDPVALQRALAEMPEAHYMNVSQYQAQAYARFRERLLLLLAGGLILVALTLLLRYRAWRPFICSLVPPVLAGLTASALLALVHQPLSLMHVMGLLLVLGMGADYGIFFVESLLGQATVGAPSLSVAMACGSTVLSFGLLALSETPALRAVGQMIGLGTLLGLVFAAVLSAWLLKDTRREQVA